MKSLMPLFCVLFFFSFAAAQNRYRLFQFNAYLYENILTKCLDTSRSGSLNAGALIKTGITPVKKKPLSAEESEKKKKAHAAEFSLSLCKKNTEPVFQPAQKKRSAWVCVASGAKFPDANARVTRNDIISQLFRRRWHFFCYKVCA